MRLFFIAAFLACVSAVCVDGQSADLEQSEELSLLTNAFNHSGDKLIRSGTFIYEVISEGDFPDAKEIAELNRQAKARLLAASEAAVGPKLKEHLKSLAETDNDFGPSMVANANVRLQYFAAFSGPLVGGDHYLERRKWDAATKRFSKVDCSLVRTYGDGKSDCIWIDQFLSGKVGPMNEISAVQQAPQLIGRLSGAALMIGQEVMLEHTEKIEASEGLVFDNHPAIKLSCFVKDFHTPGLAKINYTVVPDMNYIVPLIQEFDAEGNILYECKCDEYFEAKQSGLLFPGRCTTTSSITGERRLERYSFDPANVSLNVKVPKSQLEVQVPVGGELYVIDTAKTLKAHEPVALGIDDVPDLAQNPSFHMFGDGPPRLSSTRKIPLSLIWLISGGLLLVAVILFLIKRRIGFVGVLLISSCIMPAAGCVSEIEVEDRITVDRVVDLGNVAAEQEEINFCFHVRNPYRRPLTLCLEPDCSCVSLKNL